MDRGQFAVLMAKLSACFRTEATPMMAEVYFEKLEQCSMYQVDRAINELMETSEHFPYLSKILALARSFKREPSAPVSDSLQIDEVATLEGAPRDKEAFFKNIYAKFDNP